uniref:Uncharacterized protein n=1 Tax=Romanomermis culicivorax TaxID=13658 RepID=A0A915J5X3_ROMCU
MNLTFDKKCHLWIGDNGTKDDKWFENFIVGSIYVSTSLIFISIYVLCLTIIYKDKSLLKLAFYKIAFNMGLAEIGQLLFNGLFFGLGICAGEMIVSFRVQKLFSGLLGTCWFAYIFLAHALAVNRVVTLFSPRLGQSWFSEKVTHYLIIAAWLHSFVWLVVYVHSSVTLNYCLALYSMHYGDSQADSGAKSVNLVVVMVHAVSIVICYLIISFRFKNMRNDFSYYFARRNDTIEWKICLQAIILCVLILGTIVGFFVDQDFMISRWFSFASNMIWLLCAGGNAIVYLTLNSTLQSKIAEFIKEERPTQEYDVQQIHIDERIYRSISS